MDQTIHQGDDIIILSFHKVFVSLVNVFFINYRRFDNRIGDVMDSVLARLECGRSCVRAPMVLNQRIYNWYVLLLHSARSIKEKEKRLVGSDSE